MTTKMTFEAWIKPDLESSFGTTVAMSGDYDWAIMLACGGSEVGCCGTHANGAVAFFPGVSLTNPGEECATMPSSDAGLDRGVWTHVAVTVDIDAASVKFYLNGILAGSSTAQMYDVDQPVSVSLRGNPSDAFLVGCAHASCEAESCGCFRGEMDDVRVWNDVLSYTSISDWYTNQASNVF